MTRLGVAILAGGQGSRIGGDKPMRRLDGSTLLERTKARTRSWAAPTVLVLRAPDQTPSGGLTVIYDDPTIPGPLGGLAATLTWAMTTELDAVLTVPCDMPFLPHDLPDRLRQALLPGVAVALAASDGRRHPVCALWRPAALDVLRERAGQGRLSLHGLADAMGAVEVIWSDPGHDAFFNINTEDDLARAEGQTRVARAATG